jgi:hypothetical protein
MLSDDALQCSGLFDIGSVRLLRQKANSSPNGLSEMDEMAVAAIVSTQLLYHHFIAELVPSLGRIKSNSVMKMVLQKVLLLILG